MTEPSICPSCGETLHAEDLQCPSCGAPRPGQQPASPSPRGATEVFQASSTAGEGATEREGDTWPEIRQQLETATESEFTILRELGRGGMAAVYLAQDLALGRNVAIKVMAPGLLLGPGMVERFRQEAVTVASLHHPNIVTIHTVRQAGSLHFFVMQLVEGGSLEGVLRSPEPLPIPLVQAILYQVGTGLAYAHRHGVVHRDIKPANVLLDCDGNAILTDFGIAKVTTASNLTQTGSTVGTPAYMSPEQCLARELSGASDQYSLGVVAYEMLVGHPPFDGSPFEIMQGHTSSVVPGIVEQRADCPLELEAAVLRMLAKDPEERFPTIAEAIEAIGGYLPGPRDPLRLELAHLVKPDIQAPTAGWGSLAPIPPRTPSPVPASRTPAPAPATPPRRRSRLPFLVGGAVGLAIAGTAAFMALQGFREGEAPPPTPPTAPVIAAIAFASPAESLSVGATARIQAQIQDAEGQAVSARDVAWTSGDSSIAVVDGAGSEAVVTGLAAGTTAVRATTGGVVGTVQIVVSEPTHGALRVSTPRRELRVGEDLALAAILTDPNGQPVPDVSVTWHSSDPRILAVDVERGVATGRSPGRAQVTATSQEQSATVILTVLGRVQSLSVSQPTPPLEVGRSAVVRATVAAEPEGYRGTGGLRWDSSDPSVASIAASGGDSAVVALRREGEATVSARADDIQGSVTLQVRPPAPSVSVSLSPASVAFEAVEGGPSPAEKSVAVTVAGGAAPFLGVVQYEGTARDWLRTSLEEGSGRSVTLALRVDTNGLEAGAYQASVPVGAGSESQELSVRLDVAPRPVSTAVEATPAAEREIADLLSAYAAAINTKNEARIRELYPSISQDGIRDLMRVQESDIFQVLPLSGTLRAGREERTLDIDVSAGIVPATGAGQTRRMTYTVGRGDDGSWHIVSVRASGQAP